MSQGQLQTHLSRLIRILSERRSLIASRLDGFRQLKMARAALGFGLRDVARLAGVSPDTMAQLERFDDLDGATIEVIKAAFETADVEFIAENVGGTGIRLKKERRSWISISPCVCVLAEGMSA